MVDRITIAVDQLAMKVQGQPVIVLTEEQALEAKIMLAKGFTCREIAEELDTTRDAIQFLSQGTTWNHVQFDGDLKATRRERIRHSTLTDQDAGEILWLCINVPWLMQWQIGERYRTTEDVVGSIKRREHWEHIAPIKPSDRPWQVVGGFNRRI